jgi:putative flippase GtrA
MVQGPACVEFAGLMVCTVVNAEANRRLTFSAPASGLGRTQLEGFIAFLGYCTITSGSLALLDELNPVAPRWAEVVVLVSSSMIGTLGRFVALRSWVFSRRESAQHRQPEVHPRVRAPDRQGHPRRQERPADW